MATLKEIKSHIKSVDDTAKITSAMYLISSGKYKALKSQIALFSPYMNSLEAEIESAGEGVTAEECVYTRKGGGDTAVLAVASDKGLCGDYNRAVFRALQRTLAENPQAKVFAIGAKLKKLLDAAGIEYEKDFDFPMKNPDEAFSAKISEYFCSAFREERFSRVSAVYTSFEDGRKAVEKTLLPINAERDETQVTEFEYFPSKTDVLDCLVPIYLSGVFFNIFLQSYISEQYSRMLAMDSANINATSLLEELKIQYNHLRQNAITTEITEISNERKRNDR